MTLDFKKASQSFDQLPFKERLQSIFSLLKNTLTIVGRDRDIVKPWVRMMIYHFFMVSFFFYAWFGWFYELPGEGWSLFAAFLLFLYKHFYNNRQEMRLSWIVNETLIGHDPSYKGAKKDWKQIKSQTRKVAWLDIAMAFVDKAKYFGSGFMYMLIRLFISGLDEVWDLANHYLIPSVAIDKLDLKPALKRMKKLKDEVPETLVGVFGIDFIGSVVARVTIPTYIELVILAIAAGYFGTAYLPSSSVTVSGSAVAFSWVPIVAALYIGKLFSTLFERCVTAVKVIYFTVFYTKITHPASIMEELQEELVDYLKLKHVEQVDKLDEQELEEKGSVRPATT